MPVDLTRLESHASAAIQHLTLEALLNGCAWPCAETRMHTRELEQREQEFVEAYATSIAGLTSAIPPGWTVDKRVTLREVTYRILQVERSPDYTMTTMHLANPSTSRMA